MKTSEFRSRTKIHNQLYSIGSSVFFPEIFCAHIMRTSENLLVIHQQFFSVKKINRLEHKKCHIRSSTKQGFYRSKFHWFHFIIDGPCAQIFAFVYSFRISVPREVHIGMSEVLILFKIISFLKKGTWWYCLVLYTYLVLLSFLVLFKVVLHPILYWNHIIIKYKFK